MPTMFGDVRLADAPQTFAEKQAAALAQIEAIRWQKTQTFAYGPFPAVACDDQAQSRITSTLTLLAQPEAAGMSAPWAMSPTVTVALDYEGLRQLGLAAGVYVQTVWAHRGQLVAAILAADEAALATIDVTAGWP